MILLRHCQSEFNLHYTRTRRDPGLVDPGLTGTGLEQVAAAADTLCGRVRIARIVVSPYRRALQTAAPIAARLGLPITVSSLVRERYAFACDIGSPPAVLERDWPGIDFSSLEACWWHDGSRDGDGAPALESAESVIARAERFRGEMARTPDWAETLLVSHWGFLLALSGYSIENGRWTVIDPTRALERPIVWQHGAPGDAAT